MVVVNGWTLYPYPEFEYQIAKLEAQVGARKAKDPAGWASSADAKLFNAIEQLTQEIIPVDPGAKQYRQGETLGTGRKHWFRAKFGNGRYRLFFQFNSAAKIIIYAWVNDAQTLRTYGSKTDAYAVFRSMLAKGNPPDRWEELMKAVGPAGMAAPPKKRPGAGKPKVARRKR